MGHLLFAVIKFQFLVQIFSFSRSFSSTRLPHLFSIDRASRNRSVVCAARVIASCRAMPSQSRWKYTPTSCWFLWLWIFLLVLASIISFPSSRVDAFTALPSLLLLGQQQQSRVSLPDSPYFRGSVMGSSLQNNQNNTSDQSIKEELTESSIDTTAQSYQTPVKHELGKDPAVDSPTDVSAFPSFEEEEEESPTNKCAMNRPFPVSDFRSQVLRLPLPMAHMCSILASSSTTTAVETAILVDPLAQTFHELLVLANLSEITLRRAIDQKMALNRKKYPVEMCKVRASTRK